MQVTSIEAECVQILCYYGHREFIIPTIQRIATSQEPLCLNTHKVIKIVFLVSGLPLSDYNLVYESLLDQFG